MKLHLQAPRERVYRALIDPDAIARWRVPDDMSSRVHSFEAREGGTFRVSLTYEAPDAVGKTVANTDTYHGRFVRLVPNEVVVEAIEFESGMESMQGEMVITWQLSEAADGGTELLAVHQNVPPGVSLKDNELGWSMSLRKGRVRRERLISVRGGYVCGSRNLAMSSGIPWWYPARGRPPRASCPQLIFSIACDRDRSPARRARRAS
jgi:uncharacterized protein YndB with AHSA1/START domain